jgi:superfamily II DNA or RNA helicase
MRKKSRPETVIASRRPKHGSLLVVDESHHTTSATYRRVIAYYRSTSLSGVDAAARKDS